MYEMRGRDIYSERGKLVATLDGDGNPVMAPGMAGPHSAKVKAFLQGAERGAEADVRPETGNRKPETREATVEDIPEDRLPPFSPEFGTATPGFAEFVAKHQFTAPQVAALIRRLETK